MTEELLPFCECGECGLRVTKKGNRFIHNHHRRGKHHTPETCAKMSEWQKGVPKSPEHNAAVSEGCKNSEAAKAESDRQRGGNDLVTHHFIYDHNDLSLNTVQMTRKDHMRLHRLLQKIGYKVPRINVPR